MTKHHDDNHAKVAAYHYLHWLLTFAATFWAGQQLGWLWAVGILIGLVAVISTTNSIVLAKTGSLPLLRANRWFWLLLTIAAVAWHSGSIEAVPAG